MSIKNVEGTITDSFYLGADKEAEVRIVRGADHKLYLVDVRDIGVPKLIPINIDDLDDVPIKPTSGSKIIVNVDGVIEWQDKPVGAAAVFHETEIFMLDTKAGDRFLKIAGGIDSHVATMLALGIGEIVGVTISTPTGGGLSLSNRAISSSTATPLAPSFAPVIGSDRFDGSGSMSATGLVSK